jgi:3-oxoacyl-[acyl-carrier protein] reductase
VKRALVTGGSGDIGNAICRRLAADGLHVIVHACGHGERGTTVVEAIRAAGGSSEGIVFDVTDPEATRAHLEELLAGGPIQVLVNNAGIYDDGLMAGMRFEQWQRVIDVCLNGFFTVTKPLLLPMLRTRWGRIITVTSVAGIIGNKGQTNYAAAKSGLHGATKALALEVASRGITVNAVAPGVIDSSVTDREFDPEMIKRLVPMQRAGTREEVAALVSFLASQEAGYISGQVININGCMA